MAYEMRISDWISDVCSSDLILDDIGDTRAGGGVPLVVIIVKARLGFLAPALLGGERVADALAPHGVAVPADIDAGEIAPLARPQRHPEIAMHTVDMLGGSASHQQLLRLDLAPHHHPGPDEPSAHPPHPRDLPNIIRQRHPPRQ